MEAAVFGSPFSYVSYDRLWLFATIRRIANYVGFRSSSGNWDAEFPFLNAQRTHADDPWTAASEPKEIIKTGLRRAKSAAPVSVAIAPSTVYGM